ncbi:XdhC/CoxI family protein [soil metagenome]
MSAAEALHFILQALKRGESVAEALVTASEAGEIVVGSRLLVFADRIEGTLGSARFDADVAEIGRDRLSSGASISVDLTFAVAPVSLYLGIHRPEASLVILGAGHIARPLCRIGSLLGYRVTVLDDRPEFATDERFPEAERVIRIDSRDPFRDIPLNREARLVLVTRGHRHDFEALRMALRLPQPPGYIGMVGSQRRVRATLEQLAREGVETEMLRSVHAPIGLDIGAQTPEEIAVAIGAELVRIRRGGSGTSLRERNRVVDRWITPSK